MIQADPIGWNSPRPAAAADRLNSVRFLGHARRRNVPVRWLELSFSIRFANPGGKARKMEAIMSNKVAVFLIGAILGTIAGIAISYFGLPLLFR